MKKTSTQNSLVVCILAISLAVPAIALCEGNARQSSIQGGGTEAGLVNIDSQNTIHGDIISKNNSTVSVGDVDISNTKVSTIKISTVNEAKAIRAENNSIVKMGSVNVSNFEGGTLHVTTENKVAGKIKAQNNSQATIGNVNIH